MAKTVSSDQHKARFGAPVLPQHDRNLPPEIRPEPERREPNDACPRESRIADLRRQYRSGTYYVPTAEISAALIEKHLKR